MAKGSGGGKFLTGLLCFILGFIFAIAAEAALIAGGIYWLYHSDLETIFDTFGIENTQEENGEVTYVYINTAELTTISDLVEELQSIAEKGTDNLTLGDLDKFPVVDSVVDRVYSALASVLDMSEDEVYDLIDKDELSSTVISELPSFLTGCVGNLKVLKLLDVAGIEVGDNLVYLSLAYGAEADLIEIDGNTYILYSEAVTADESSNYTITASGSALSSVYASYVYETTNKLYYYVLDDGKAYIAQRSGTTFSQAYTDDSQTTLLEYTQYDASTATYSGAYYYNESGALEVLNYKTVNDLLDGGIDSIFYDIYIADLITVTDENEVFIDAFDGVTVGDIMTDGLDVYTILEDVLVTDMLGNEDDVITEMFEGVTFGELMRDGLDIDELLEKVYVPEVMDVSATNGVMAFIGYSLTGVEEYTGTDTLTYEGAVVAYNYTATLHLYSENGNGEEVDTTYDAYVVADAEGIITAVYYYDTTSGTAVLTEYDGVTVGDISAQTDRLMDTVTINDIVEFNTQNGITEKIGASTINGIGSVIDTITVADAMGDVTTEDSVVLYMAYGVTGLSETPVDNGDGTYTFTATYHDYDGNSYEAAVITTRAEDGQGGYTYTVQEAYYTEAGQQLAAETLVNDISDRINNLMDDLTLGELIDTQGSTVLSALSDSTINSLADDFAELAIQQVFYEDIYAQNAAYKAEVKTVDSYTVASQLKVVKESIASAGGIYYYWNKTSLTTSSTNAVATYWAAAGSTILYEVIDFSSEYLYFDSNFEYVTVNTDAGHLDSYLSTYGVLYTYGEPQNAWYFMLLESSSEKLYPIDNISDLIDNATGNIQGATLNKLVETGMVTSDTVKNNLTSTVSGSVLKTLYPNAGYDENGTYALGTLTLAQALDVLVSMLGGTGN